MLCWQTKQNVAPALCQIDAPKRSVFARSGYTQTLARLKHGTVSGADQAAFPVDNKPVRCPVERPALMGTNVEPGFRFTLMACRHQRNVVIVAVDYQLLEAPLDKIFTTAKEHFSVHGVSLFMHNPWQRYYQPPSSPLARLGLVLLGIGILALSFILGLFFLAIAIGMAVIGFIVLTVRRWLGGGGPGKPDDGTIDVEYRVVDRERKKDE